MRRKARQRKSTWPTWFVYSSENIFIDPEEFVVQNFQEDKNRIQKGNLTPRRLNQIFKRGANRNNGNQVSREVSHPESGDNNDCHFHRDVQDLLPAWQCLPRRIVFREYVLQHIRDGCTHKQVQHCNQCKVCRDRKNMSTDGRQRVDSCVLHCLQAREFHQTRSIGTSAVGTLLGDEALLLRGS